MDLHELRAIADTHYEDFVEALGAMVDVDCGSYTPAGVNAIADQCQARFEAGGWEVRRTPHVAAQGESQLGDLVIGRLPGAGGPRVLLIGHTDTVFDEGTVVQRPFRVEGDTCYGPGVSDMKGGLLVGFFAVEVLQAAGFDGFGGVNYICNPDEEIGSPFSRSFIQEAAEEADVCLVLESGRANGDFVSARKGVSDYRIEIVGRAAHAGVEPEKGRNAILEAAHKTIAWQSLNGRWPGVTVNAGVVHGGTRTNVISERCLVEIDVRSPQEETLRAAEDEIERIAREHTIPDIEVRIESGKWHRPMEKKDGTSRLAALAIEVARDLGFVLRDAATGGASDANTTSALGIPTIDGLGPVGGDDHAPGEWVDLTSAVPRISLLAGIISRLPALS